MRKMIDAGRVPSIILWGPPGVGKTTLAQIISHKLETPFYTLSAISSGVKDVRDVIEKAKSNRFFNTVSPILFIDEIHRFSKSQQDSLLNAVETGVVTLIGATTENPSFEVIRPLLSRCQVYVLKSLEKADLLKLLERAITTDEVLKGKKIKLTETDALLRYSGGDARKLLNILELVIAGEERDDIEILDKKVVERLQENPLAYDKGGEMHYDIISAFIKSIRGSDPDAAIYWLARMVAGGEDPEFIARRLVISASEDIGLANPNALLLANACFETLRKIGWPEGRIVLAETTVYLACSPKSNSAYKAINDALALVERTGNLGRTFTTPELLRLLQENDMWRTTSDTNAFQGAQLHFGRRIHEAFRLQGHENYLEIDSWLLTRGNHLQSYGDGRNGRKEIATYTVRRKPPVTMTTPNNTETGSNASV